MHDGARDEAGTKLIIQIPCYNEEETLAQTLADLPAQIEGIDSIEVLVIDDGSTDRTAEVARTAGAHHVVSFKQNMGLARAFTTGLETALKLGAGIIVNTDGDNQYCADDIPKLVRPILEGGADVVVGARPIEDIAHFSWTKKLLQRLGSWVVRRVSGTGIADSPSGFRAMSKEAALRMNVFGNYTYTLETVIQAGLKGLAIRSTPIRTNGQARPSRLVKSSLNYVVRSIGTILRVYAVYRPLEFFWRLSALPLVAGGALLARWLLLYWFDDPTRVRAPSLIAATILVILGGLGLMAGLMADLLAANRKMLEEIQYRLRRQEVDRLGEDGE